MESTSQKTKLTIGRLAQAAGVSVETVRYYQRRGLLHEPKKPLGGFRCYGERDLLRLCMIRQGKELGFTLAEIARLTTHIEEQDCDAVRMLAEQKLRAIKSQIRLLEKVRRTLRSLLAGCTRDCLDNCPVLRRLNANGLGAADGD